MNREMRTKKKQLSSVNVAVDAEIAEVLRRVTRIYSGTFVIVQVLVYGV